MKQEKKPRPPLRLVAQQGCDDHKPLSHVIRDQLRAAILGGSLKPGQVLRQEELAEQFKTSRVPLREALQTLQAEGLVLLRPRRGYAVYEARAEELIELLRLRVLVEGFGGYAGASKRTARDAAVLNALLAEMEKLPAKLVRESQRCRWWSLDRAFHRSIYGAGGNVQLSLLFDGIAARLDPYLLADKRSTDSPDAAMDDHRKLAAAFARGDADRVALISRRHAEALAAQFLAHLEARGKVAPGSAQTLFDLGPAAAVQDPPPARPAARKRCAE